MPRYRLDIAYDGTAYSGWQRQPNARTVQGTIEKALTKMNGGSAIALAGASRTDAGVHAELQVAVFDYSGRLTARDFARGLNALTPDDILVRAVHVVDDAFHPRFASVGKWYRYLIWERRHAPPSYWHRVWGLGHRLDLEAMVRGGAHLVGQHDFSAFRASDCEARSAVRTISSVEVHAVAPPFLTACKGEPDRLCVVDVRGNAFLKNMVRIVVGTLVEVGLTQRDPSDVAAVLTSRDRTQAGRTAPASGLSLVRVFFPADTLQSRLLRTS